MPERSSSVSSPSDLCDAGEADRPNFFRPPPFGPACEYLQVSPRLHFPNFQHRQGRPSVPVEEEAGAPYLGEGLRVPFGLGVLPPPDGD